MHVIVMRHGQTDMNVAGLVDGQSDAGRLTPEGVKGVYYNGKEMIERYPDLVAIYTSDLRRSVETAEVMRGVVQEVYGRDIEVNLREGLREIDMGKHEGKRLPKPKFIANAISHLMIGIDVRIPGTKESDVDVHRRVVDEFNVIYDEWKDSNGRVLVITHQKPMQSIAHHITGSHQVPPGPFSIENAEYWHLSMHHRLDPDLMTENQSLDPDELATLG